MGVNKHGQECPSWCDRDREHYSCRGTGPSVRSGNGHAWTWAESIMDRPEIGLTAVPESGYTEGNATTGNLEFTARNAAESAATLIERLADYTPDQHREIAGLVRSTAAAAWPEQEAEAG